MDSVRGWFFKELEFEKMYELDEILKNTNNRKEERLIPRRGGIYIYYDRDKTPVYVGKTKNLRTRHLEHMSNICPTSVGRNKSEIKYYSYVAIDDIAERNVYEMLYIGKYKPKFNGKNDTGN